MQIDREIPIPLYQQIKFYWKDKIDRGVLKPGDRIPTEKELCELHAVSQITVKQAVKALVGEGLVVRRPRTGTFVAHPKFKQQLLRLTSFSEDMRQRGLKAGARVIEAEEEPADSQIAEALKVAEGEPIVRIERVRLAEGEPMAIEVFRMPSVLCPGLLSEDLNGRSLYQLLAEKYGLSLEEAEQSIEASLADAREARLLGIKRGAPVLRVERITRDRAGRPSELTRSVYRGDKYRLHVAMRRNP
ncbi:MAG: GntR family transcriptional regulator [Firmicutes bacterium]|jgi:GntR family transcriptional regulator|nr:GntR family transcriptional regulator [Bacillota bacterium]